MTWNAGLPQEGIIANQINDVIRTNNDALETVIEFGHNFVSPSETGYHRMGSAQMYSSSTTPTTKEDGSTALAITDYHEKIWMDESTVPAIAKVYTDSSTWTPLIQLVGMLDEDDMTSDSDVLPATQQSIKRYVDDEQLLDVKLAGSTMSGVLNMGSNLISAVTDPVGPQDAATMAYVDSFGHMDYATGTYTGNQASNNTSDMTAAKSISSVGFDPDEVTIMSETDNEQTFLKSATMGTNDAMGMGNDDYSDLVIEFISGGFKVNRRSVSNNQSCNTSGVVYHWIAKKHN